MTKQDKPAYRRYKKFKDPKQADQADEVAHAQWRQLKIHEIMK